MGFFKDRQKTQQQKVRTTAGTGQGRSMYNVSYYGSRAEVNSLDQLESLIKETNWRRKDDIQEARIIEGGQVVDVYTLHYINEPTAYAHRVTFYRVEKHKQINVYFN